MNKQLKLGRLLMVARIARGLSRREVGDRIGMDRRALGRIERGERLPSVLVFARLHKVLAFAAGAALDALAVTVVALEGKPRKVPTPQRVGTGPLFEFGHVLALARVDARLTQAQLAGAVGACPRFLARMESGRAVPSLWRFAQLRLLLGLDVDRLLALLRSEQMAPEPFAGFGQAVTRARRARAMSRGQVAAAAHCEPEVYAQVERGARLPTMRAAVRIHEVVRFDADAALRSVWESRALELAS